MNQIGKMLLKLVERRREKAESKKIFLTQIFLLQLKAFGMARLTHLRQ